MPRWRKAETEFEVSLNYDKRRGIQANIPKPVVERLGNPKRIKFVIRGRKIELLGQNRIGIQKQRAMPGT